jgi:hypothetical protein
MTTQLKQHSVFDSHSQITGCHLCEVSSKCVHFVDEEGVRPTVWACGPCYREGQVPDGYTLGLYCADCRESSSQTSVSDT